MDPIILTYTLYLLIALPLTVWVARTLHKNGRVFLVQCFHGDEHLADSVNHLLVVGFYLVNFGFVVTYLKTEQRVNNIQAVFEALSEKLGFILLVLGVMHFLNIYVFTRLRRKHELEKAAPPLPPTHVVQ